MGWNLRGAPKKNGRKFSWVSLELFHPVTNLNRVPKKNLTNQQCPWNAGFKGILATPPKATPPKNKALLRVY